ncbi:MAG: DUF1294 domain-containing protein [Oscillospiraceae bacterium]|nr:DUF1294 domain-containing protein [Oscillospiraceae bacterium]
MNELDPIVLWLVVVNGAGFLLMGLDKWKAKRNAWRIPENTLFTVAVLGGTPGVMAGMQTFRHKTRHRKFKYGLPVLLALQLAAAAWLLNQI